MRRTRRSKRSAGRRQPPELMEAIWAVAELRAGGAYAHSLLALETAAHDHGAR